jgi:hypothetical protein
VKTLAIRIAVIRIDKLRTFFVVALPRSHPVKLAALCSLWLGGLSLSLAAAQNVPNPQLPANPANPNGAQQVPQGQFGQPFNAGQGQNAAAAQAMILKQFDRDGDGKLSPQEQLAATRAMQQHGIRTPGMPNMVGPHPSGNGVQRGPAPQAAAQQQAAPKVNKREEMLLKRFDRDGDGKLSDEEKAVARAELGGKNKAEKK